MARCVCFVSFLFCTQLIQTASQLVNKKPLLLAWPESLFFTAEGLVIHRVAQPQQQQVIILLNLNEI